MSIISKFNKSVNQKGSKIVVCARVGGANTTSFLLAAHFAKRNTKFGGGGASLRLGRANKDISQLAEGIGFEGVARRRAGFRLLAEKTFGG